MKYIITGGAGFIGSCLAEFLLAIDKEVVIIDNLSTGSINNIASIIGHKKLRFLNQSIQEIKDWQRIVSTGDVIIHLAATVGVNKVVVNSLETVENNFYPTKILLDVAVRYDCRVFFSSTSEVYGDSKHISSCETDQLIVPSTHCGRGAYVLGKLMSEHYCLNYFRDYGAKVVVGRFFNITGARQVGAFGMVAPTFVKQALAGEPITIFGDGSQSRSFANVHDVIPAILSLLDAERAYGQVFNIGAEETVSILKLALYIKAVTSSISPLVFLPFPQGRENFKDIYHRKPCLDKIRSYVSLNKMTSWQQTIAQMIDAQSHINQQVTERQTVLL